MICDQCGTEFFSRGVIIDGLGTFCGYKCRVLAAHEKALPQSADQLHTFQCQGCHVVLVVSFKSSRAERCLMCRRYLTFIKSEPVVTDEDRALHRQGRVWNPGAQGPKAWACARCGESTTEHGRIRPDGRVCLRCYHAEAGPPLLTPEQIEVRRLEKLAQHKRLLDQFRDAPEGAEQEHS